MARRRARSPLFKAALGATTTAFDPVSLFGKYSASGFYYNFDDITRQYTDAAQTTPVASDGDSIGGYNDLSPGNNDGSQTTAAAKPTFKTGSPNYASFDGGDYLDSGYSPGSSMTMVACLLPTVANTVAVGSSNAAFTSRCWLGVNATDGVAVFGFGDANVNASADIRNAAHVVLGRSDGSTKEIWVDGALINSSAVAGAVPALSMYVGAANVNGSAGLYFTGREHRVFVINVAIGDADVVPLMRALGAGVVTI